MQHCQVLRANLPSLQAILGVLGVLLALYLLKSRWQKCTTGILFLVPSIWDLRGNLVRAKCSNSGKEMKRTLNLVFKKMLN